jgi:hypothetical protein
MNPEPTSAMFAETKPAVAAAVMKEPTIAYANIVIAAHLIDRSQVVTAAPARKAKPGQPILVDYLKDHVLLDSGASEHMVGDISMLTDIQPAYTSMVVADGGKIDVQRKGTLTLRVFCQLCKEFFWIPLHDVLHVPRLRQPLVSVNHCTKQKHHVFFRDEIVEFHCNVKQPEYMVLYLSHPFHTNAPHGNSYSVHVDWDPELRLLAEAEKEKETPSPEPEIESADNDSNRPTEIPANAPADDAENDPEPDPYRQTEEAIEETADSFTEIPTTRRNTARIITLERLHFRLGHTSMNSLLAGSQDQIWDTNVKVQFEADPFCTSCHIGAIRRKNRGVRKLTKEVKPGAKLHLDVIYNTAEQGLTQRSHYRFYLAIADAASRAYFFVGMANNETASVIAALNYFCAFYRPRSDYTINDIRSIHADAGTNLLSEELKAWCIADGRNIQPTNAAPHHQEQNSLSESRWRQAKAISNKLLLHARLSDEFQNQSLIHAALIANLLPVKGVMKINDKGEEQAATPFELYFGHKPNIARLRVFGCPCIFKAHVRRGGKLTSKNIIQRGVRGIWLGFPVNQAGALIWVDQVRKLIVSDDYLCDEQFRSTLAYTYKPYADAQPTRAPFQSSDPDRPVAHTGPPAISEVFVDSNAPWALYTALPITYPAPEIDFEEMVQSDELDSAGHPIPSPDPLVLEEEMTLEFPELLAAVDDEPDPPNESIDSDGNDELLQEEAAEPVPIVATRSGRQSKPPAHLQDYATCVTAFATTTMPPDLAAMAAEVLNETLPKPLGDPGTDPTAFLPEPRTMKQVLREPFPVRAAWTNLLSKSCEVLSSHSRPLPLMIHGPTTKSSLLKRSSNASWTRRERSTS